MNGQNSMSFKNGHVTNKNHVILFDSNSNTSQFQSPFQVGVNEKRIIEEMLLRKFKELRGQGQCILSFTIRQQHYHNFSPSQVEGNEKRKIEEMLPRKFKELLWQANIDKMAQVCSAFKKARLMLGNEIIKYIHKKIRVKGLKNIIHKKLLLE